MTRNEKSLQALFSGNKLIKSDYDLNDGYDTNFNFMKIDQSTLFDEFRKIGYRLMDYWRSDEDLFFSVIHDNTETPFCYNEGTGDLFAGSKYLCIDNVSGEKELVDTVKWYEEGGWKTIESSRRPIKSSAGTIHCVYLSDITPTEWTKDMALAAIKNSVTNYGYYEYNGKKGFCIVGDFEDIHNFIESVGHAVDEDNLYHWKEFPWDNAKKLDKRYSGQDYWNREGITNSRRPIMNRYEVERMIIKSSYLVESDAEWIESAGKWKALALAGILALGMASPLAAKTKKVAQAEINPQQKIDMICDAMSERGDTTIYLWDEDGSLTEEGKALQKALGELGRDDGFGFGPGVKSIAIELANHGITLVNEDGKPILKADGGFSW